MYIMKSRGPRTDPWGTPDITSAGEGRHRNIETKMYKM
jgi:hypothetical protein